MAVTGLEVVTAADAALEALCIHRGYFHINGDLTAFEASSRCKPNVLRFRLDQQERATIGLQQFWKHLHRLKENNMACEDENLGGNGQGRISTQVPTTRRNSENHCLSF